MKCRYCGEQAGFLRREHDECRERHRGALAAVPDAVRAAAVEGRGWRAIEGDLDRRMEDGFSLTRDRANARPEMFLTGDGWFAFNVVTNAGNLET